MTPLIREKQTHAVIDQLVRFISSKEEETRDIASLGLKTVVAELPNGSALAKFACDSLAPKLLVQVTDPSSSQELLIDSLDVLSDLFARFPRSVLENAQLQKTGLQSMLPLLSHPRVAVRKRATTALGALAAHSSSETFTQLSTKVSVDLSEEAKSDVDRTKTVVQLVGALARSSPRRVGRRLPEFMPRVLATASRDDDELREASLHTLELVLWRCPTEVTPFLNQLVDAALQLIKHDPNYAGDLDDEEADDEDMEDEDEDDDLNADEDYSDDDDVSWKVRRAAAKVIGAAIATRPEMLATFAASVAPVLVSRFSEREESVRLEILQTFLSLVKQAQWSGGLAQATEVQAQSPGALKRKRGETEASSNPIKQLRNILPTIGKALFKELASKTSSSTRLICTTVLRELVVLFRGGFDAQIPSLVAQLDKSIKTVEVSSGAGSSLKAEIIALLRVIFLLHSPAAYEAQVPVLIPFLAASITSKSHRDSIEAFDASRDLIACLYQRGNGLSDASMPTTLYEATMSRLNRADSDQEIKEKGIATLGVLLANCSPQLQSKLSECLPMLIDRLRNEVTRLATVKVVDRMAASKVCTGAEYDDFFKSAIDVVVTLVRQSNRALKLVAFETLSSALQRLGGELPSSSASAILEEITVFLTQDLDLTLVPHALKAAGLLLAFKRDLYPAARDTLLPQVLELVKSPLLHGLPLDAVIAFVNAFVTLEPSQSQATIATLKQTFASGGVATSVARCIGAVVQAEHSSVRTVLDEAAGNLQVAAQAGGKGQSTDANGDQDMRTSADSTTAFNLLVLGEVARLEDFKKHQQQVDVVSSFFESDNDDIRASAALALGNMAVGNTSAFLPVICQHMQSESSKHRLLALNALKELITHGSAQNLSQVAEDVWSPLFEISQTKDEATRTVGAECLARLTLTDPSRYLVQLQSKLNDPTPSTRAAVIAAVRFTLTEASTSFDELLAPNFVEFLSLLEDEDLDVRRHAMFALNSAAHNKPQLIRDHLNIILPLLYGETHVRKELMRKVAMGPFTVTQDDGLDLRKNAFETMYTLLDTCLNQLNMPEYLSRVIAGLRDDDQVKLLCYLILVRLSDLAPLQVAQALDEISEPIGDALKIKLKDGATKQDVEKSTELTRAAFRALVALSKLTEGGGGASAPKFQQLFKEARNGQSAMLFAEVQSSSLGQR